MEQENDREGLDAIREAHLLHHAREQAMLEHAIRTAEAAPEELHMTMLMNMTTKPEVPRAMLTLTWMQRSPEKWRGWHPEECQHVADANGMTEKI